MSRFYKVILSVAGGCLILGILICLIAGATGGWSLISNGFDRDWNWNNSGYTNTNTNIEYEDIQKAFEGDIQSLDLEIAVGNVTIEQGDTFSLKATDVVKGTFKTMKVEDGVLKIVQKYNNRTLKFFNIDINLGVENIGLKDFKMAKITITVPEGFKAEDFLFDFGVGNTIINGISSDYTYLSLGAGNVDVTDFSTDSIKVDCGVGGLAMKNVILNDLKLDNGVGNTDIQGIVTGDSSIDCGVGNMTLDLSGNINDYDFKIDNGVGKVRVNGEKFDNKKTIGASNSFDINGGVGTVDIEINLKGNLS